MGSLLVSLMMATAPAGITIAMRCCFARSCAGTVRVPLANSKPIVKSRRLIRHLVGAGEDRGRDREAERLGGLEIDDMFEHSRLLDRKIGRLGALEEPSELA